MKQCCYLTMLLGRIAISAIFIFAGIHKLIDYQASAQYMASKELSFIPFLLYAAAIVEILGGLSVLLGYKTRYGALLLALFLIPVNYFFHDFWNLSIEHEVKEQTILFFSNTAIFGGLLYVFANGAGPYSFDRNACCKNTDCSS